jgi:hypothetical protein
MDVDVLYAGKSCVRFHVAAEEYVVTKVEKNSDEKKQWVFRFEVPGSTNFNLLKPESPNLYIYVPGKTINICRHIFLDAKGEANSEYVIDEFAQQLFNQNEGIPKEFK